MPLIELLEARGAITLVIPPIRRYPSLTGRKSEPWSVDLASKYEAVIVVTDHDCVDYGAIMDNAMLVVDTRNACRRAGINSSKLVLA